MISWLFSEPDRKNGLEKILTFFLKDGTFWRAEEIVKKIGRRFNTCDLNLVITSDYLDIDRLEEHCTDFAKKYLRRALKDDEILTILQRKLKNLEANLAYYYLTPPSSLDEEIKSLTLRVGFYNIKQRFESICEKRGIKKSDL